LNRILVIRGGAIGDFVLTLPAIRLLRDRWPNARLEILGYKHIIALAENRFYADAVRSIEYGPLASFFARGADLPEELREYFGSFDLIVSYLYDPDGIFAGNLSRCGSMQIVRGSGKVAGDEHAARQLARPLESLGLSLESPAAQLFPNDRDRQAAAVLLNDGERLIAIHPGSGSSTKNWSIDRWAALAQHLAEHTQLVVIGGEADTAQIGNLRAALTSLPVTYVVSQPLTTVAAVLVRCVLFIGHDSGISHIAAAVGIKCLLLFGPTDPKVWAPQNANAHVLRPANATLADLTVDEVRQELMRIGIST
jgi:heptosyltransferase III